MKFEWDPQKAESNLKKHGVSFQEAASVFGNALSLTYYDPDHSAKEQRFITAGTSRTGKFLMVAHTERGDNVRIIGARKMTRQERKSYEEGK
jgi:uncharacterized DUF497 family protein